MKKSLGRGRTPWQDETGDGHVNDPGVSILVIGKQEHADSVITEALNRKGHLLKAVPDAQHALGVIEEDD